MANQRKISSGRHAERGIALLLCIFALLLLTGIALSLIFMSDTETQINSNYKDSQRAYFSAMAGLQEARVRLMPDPVTGALSPLAPTTMPGAGLSTGVSYITNSNGAGAVAPWNAGNAFFDDQLCHDGFATALGVSDPGANVPCTAAPGGTYYKTFASDDPNTGNVRAMDYRWVRITQKGNLSAAPYFVADAATTLATTPICWTGTTQIPLPLGVSCELYTATNLTTVYRVTSLATSPGGSRRVLQMEMANTPPLVTNAAVDSQDHVTLNGQLTVNGYDYCSCSCTTTKVSGNDVTTCTDRPGKTCDRSKWAIYASNTIDSPNNSENLIAGPNPPYVQNQPWLYDIPQLINTYKQGATSPAWTCTPPTSPGTNADCGTHSGGVFGVPPAFPPSPVDNPVADPSLGTPTPQVTYIPGNTQLTGGTIGNGILIVDGDLDIHGGLQFYGLVLVKGVVKFTGGGSDKTNIFGAVLAGQESYVDNVLGGSAVINFNLCALKQKQSPQPPVMISFHELTY